MINIFSSITYTNKDRIEDYFMKHPWLKNVVTRAHKKLKEYFPKEKFELCYKIDTANFHRGDGEEEGYLVLYVVTKMKPRPAKDILVKFDEEWWVNQNKQCYDHLAININSIGAKK